MRKSIIISLFLILFLATSSHAFFIRFFTSLTGDVAGSIDNVTCADVYGTEPSTSDGVGVVITSAGDVYFYYFDQSDTTATSSPDYIRCKTYTTSGVWILASAVGGTIVAQSNCATITEGVCLDTDDGKLYVWNGAAVVLAGVLDWQPLDSDLTSLAALTTDAFGRGLIELTTAAALLSAAGVVPVAATINTIDDCATTELFVGGGAGVAPVCTTATGTGAPVRAGSPEFTGTVTMEATSTPHVTMTDSDAAGVGNININSSGASTLNLNVDDASSGDDTPYIQLDGPNEQVEIKVPLLPEVGTGIPYFNIEAGNDTYQIDDDICQAQFYIIDVTGPPDTLTIEMPPDPICATGFIKKFCFMIISTNIGEITWDPDTSDDADVFRLPLSGASDPGVSIDLNDDADDGEGFCLLGRLAASSIEQWIVTDVIGEDAPVE